MFGLGLTRYVPAPARPYATKVATAVGRRIRDVFDERDLRTKVKDSPRAFRGERIAIVGFTDAATGLGRGARLMQKAFEQRGANVAAFDAALIIRRGAAGRKERDRLIEFAPTDCVLHISPPLMRDLIRRLPRAFTERTCIVGYWAWELSRLPEDWLADSKLCDAIWTPSEFVADAARASLTSFAGDISAKPHAVEADPFPNAAAADKRAAREALRLPANAFVAGYAFTMASNFTRKNPTAAIAAFQKAFPAPATQAARLLLRCPDGADFPSGHKLLREASDADPRILLFDRETAPLLTFYQALDVYLSLQRSEGFGLQIYEALQTGLDVVGVAWSLSEQIVSHANFHAIGSTLTPVADPQHVYDRIPDAVWAEPNIEEAALALKRLATLKAESS